MRARILFAAGMATLLAGACSKPPADTGLDEDLAKNLELALTASEAEPVVAVASELEAPRPQERVRRPPPQQEIEPTGDEVEVAANEPARQASVTPTSESTSEPTFTVSPLPTTWAEPVPVTGPVAQSRPEEPGQGAAGSGPRAGDEADEHPRGRGPGIIIRGGIGERDPCAIHMPGRGPGAYPGGIGILINERSPRSIPGMGSPTFPRGGSGGFGGARGGIRF